MSAADDDRSRAVLPVTSVRDGYEHLVAEHLMTLGNAGHYPALCGHRVWAAMLACPSGPPCRNCRALRQPRHPGVARRHRRATQCRRWVRLLAWLFPSVPTRPGRP